jgi:large subunit ribosomal protein L22
MSKDNVKKEPVKKEVQTAKASAMSLHISTKQSIEICSFIRYKTVESSKLYLERVAKMEVAIPFKRFNRDMGHKKNMAAGRYPLKAVKEFLKLLRSVEANAQVLGLDASNLKIVTAIANKASAPVTGGRHRRGTKRTHLYLEVQEIEDKKSKKVARKSVKKVTKKAEPKQEKTKVDKAEVKPVEEKKVEKPKVEEKKPEVTEKSEPEVKEAQPAVEEPIPAKEDKPAEPEKEVPVNEAPAEPKVEETPKTEEKLTETKEDNTEK